jgi:hypothetical protein
MIYKLTDSNGGTPLTLVDGPASASADYAQGPIGGEERFSAQQSVSVRPLIRADAALVTPRKNHAASCPFSALRTFNSAAAAREWAAKHTQAVIGLTRLVISGDGGGSVTLSGGITRCECHVRGVSVLIDYEFTYGEIT